jgi:hypothetical protein
MKEFRGGAYVVIWPRGCAKAMTGQKAGQKKSDVAIMNMPQKEHASESAADLLRRQQESLG